MDHFLWRMLCAVHQYNQDMARVRNDPTAPMTADQWTAERDRWRWIGERVVRVPIPLPPQAQITREWSETDCTPSVAYCRWWMTLEAEKRD